MTPIRHRLMTLNGSLHVLEVHMRHHCVRHASRTVALIVSMLGARRGHWTHN